MRYLLRRFGFYLLTLYISLTINFFLPRMMPGDPATAIFARFHGRLQPQTIEAMRKAFGFVDAPLWQQYLSYLSHAIRFDFGISISSFPTQVSKVIGTGLGWTLLLCSTSLLCAYLIGTLFGIIASWHRGGAFDGIMTPLLMFINSFPYFWLAMFAVLVLYYKLDWFPGSFAFSLDVSKGWNLKFILSVLQHLALPALSIIVVSVGGWMLGMRNTMISTLAEDYINMAEAKGMPQNRIMLRFAARNAMLPSFTSFGIAFGFIISGALLTEVVFAYPGLGWLLFIGVTQLDYPLLQGLFLMITITVLTANLLVDLLYVRLDPRVRAN